MELLPNHNVIWDVLQFCDLATLFAARQVNYHWCSLTHELFYRGEGSDVATDPDGAKIRVSCRFSTIALMTAIRRVSNVIAIQTFPSLMPEDRESWATTLRVGRWNQYCPAAANQFLAFIRDVDPSLRWLIRFWLFQELSVITKLAQEKRARCAQGARVQEDQEATSSISAAVEHTQAVQRGAMKRVMEGIACHHSVGTEKLDVSSRVQLHAKWREIVLSEGGGTWMMFKSVRP